MEESIKSIIKKDYTTIQDTETIKDAIAKFSNNASIKTILVFDEKGKYQGIVTERLLYRYGPQDENTKIKNIYINAPKIEESTSIFKASRILLENNIRHIPVFEENTLKGIVTAIDILKHSLKLTNINDVNIRKFMTSTPIIVKKDEKIANVINLFHEFSISRIPVMEDGNIKGIVSKHDIVKKIISENKDIKLNNFNKEKHSILENSIENIMSYPTFSLKPEDSVKETINLMHEKNISSVIITDPEERLSGIITKKDLLESLAALDKKEDQIFDIQIRGKHNLDNYQKSEVFNSFKEFIEKKSNLFNETYASIYIREHLGRFNKGRTRGVEMYFIRARLNTDNGTYIASTEEFGLSQCVNEVIRLLNKQIRTHEQRIKFKEKAVT